MSILISYFLLVVQKLVMPNLYTGIIAPDKGALNRAEALAHAFEVPLYIGGKTRDFETGKLTGFTMESLPEGGKFLIVDDICDGGGTLPRTCRQDPGVRAVSA